MKKDIFLSLMMLIVLCWAYPVYDSVTHDARSIGDLRMASQVMVWTGVGVFLYLMHPLFLWMWNGLKKAFTWLKNWLDGK